MKNIIRFLLFATILLGASVAMAQTYTVALYAPSLDFKDGGERNEYVNKVAMAFSKATSSPWRGQAFARASDFEAARSQFDIVIVDQDYYSSKLSSLEGIAVLTSNAKRTRRMHVLVKKGGSRNLYDYQGKKLVLTSTSSINTKFIEATLLSNEAELRSYFGSVEEARDIRSAINAVELGRADMTIAYDGYGDNLTSIYSTPAVALPVVAISSNRIFPHHMDTIKKTAQSLDIRATSLISSSSPFSASDVAAMKNLGSSAKNSIEYRLVEVGSAKISAHETPLSPRKEGLTLNPNLVQVSPSFAGIDKKLDLAL